MRALLLLTLSTTILQADWQNLWPTDAPGAKRPPAGTEKTNERGGITNIEVPQILVKLPPKESANGSAVVIFPGGGYAHLAIKHEGLDYAQWLNDLGFAAIIVKYRVGQNPGYQYPVPLLDARRAIRTTRANATEWNINPDHIGVMGSSAGGHLASLAATQFNLSFPEETTDEIDKLSARPNFAILCYPVIIMDSEIGHSGSRNNLAGKNPSPALLTKLTTYRNITKDTPPTFLIHTSDDGVDSRNSTLFANALKENKIPHALHIFPTGGHGYGLNGKGELATWPSLLEKWLNTQNP
jgi:acetyl esterase/lipase